MKLFGDFFLILDAANVPALSQTYLEMDLRRRFAQLDRDRIECLPGLQNLRFAHCYVEQKSRFRIRLQHLVVHHRARFAIGLGALRIVVRLRDLHHEGVPYPQVRFQLDVLGESGNNDKEKRKERPQHIQL
ncbi:MAG: hypothetical protein WDO18_15530 [Acidobacteriota bacterium]